MILMIVMMMMMLVMTMMGDDDDDACLLEVKLLHICSFNVVARISWPPILCFF